MTPTVARVRSIAGSFTTLNMMPLNNLLIMGTDSGKIQLYV